MRQRDQIARHQRSPAQSAWPSFSECAHVVPAVLTALRFQHIALWHSSIVQAEPHMRQTI
jgi:hypothetical protein